MVKKVVKKPVKTKVIDANEMHLHELTKEIGLERLYELAEADREGRCVVLPCKPSGVAVYQLRSKKHALGAGVHKRHVHGAFVWAGGYRLEHQGMDPCEDKDFGKTWFLDEE